jgi:hypothetical protein
MTSLLPAFSLHSRWAPVVVALSVLTGLHVGACAQEAAQAPSLQYATWLYPKAPHDPGAQGTVSLFTWTREGDSTVAAYAGVQREIAPRVARSDVFDAPFSGVMGILNYDYNRPQGDHPDATAVQIIGQVPVFDRSLFEGWNEIDVYVSFGGYVREGEITAPSPQEITVGHRNGVPVLGSLVFKGGASSSGLDAKDLVSRDGSGGLWAVGQLQLLVRTFGFDGYFFNLEEGVTLSNDGPDPETGRYLELLAALRDGGLHVASYDSLKDDGTMWYREALDAGSAKIFAASSSFFVDYRWDEEDFAISARSAGARASDVYMGVNWWEDGSRFDRIRSLVNNRPPAPSRLSLGLWAIEYPIAGGPAYDPIAPSFQLDPRGGMLRTAAGNHADFMEFWTRRTANPDRATSSVLGDYRTPRTAITRLPFVTHFNLGKGDRRFRAGAASSAASWGNLAEQDLLPHYLIREAKVAIDYDLETAWEGGSSLKVVFALGAPEVRPIYLTSIAAPRGVTVRVVFQNAGPDAARLVLLRADGTTTDLPLPANAPDWSAAEITDPTPGTIVRIDVGLPKSRGAVIRLGEIALR